MKTERIPGIAILMIVVVVICLSLNAYFQAVKYKSVLDSKAVLAVFVKKNTAMTPDVLKELIINTENVKSAEYISSEAALKNAIESTPSVNDILVSKENPFSSYFLVKAEYPGLENFEKLKVQVSKFEGIENAVYDPDHMSIRDKLEIFSGFYRFFLKASFVVMLVLLLIKICIRFNREENDYQSFLYTILYGILSGAAGIGTYVFTAQKYFPVDAVTLPSGYFGYIIMAGISLALLWE